MKTTNRSSSWSNRCSKPAQTPPELAAQIVSPPISVLPLFAALVQIRELAVINPNKVKSWHEHRWTLSSIAPNRFRRYANYLTPTMPPPHIHRETID
jgi:hypothetical protein